MKITKVADAIDLRLPKIAIAGGPGAGKTTLAASLPGKTLLVSAEAGLRSLGRLGREATAHVDVVEVADLATLGEVVRHLKATHEYEWAAFDSLSEIAEIILVAEKAKTKDPRAAYGELIDVMTKTVRVLRDLPCGVLFTMKVAAIVDDEGRSTGLAPMMPGARLAQSVPYLLDELWLLDVAPDGSRRLHTSTTPRFAAKDRSGMLDKIESADGGLTPIIEKMMASATSESQKDGE